MKLLRCEGESQLQFQKRKVYFMRLLEPRLNDCKNELQHYLNSDWIQPIDRHTLGEIKDFWRSFLGNYIYLIDFKWFDVFNTIEENKNLLKYYIPFDINIYIDEYFTNPQWSSPCDDKNLYDLYFHDIKLPQTVFRKIEGGFLDSNYKKISINDVIKLCRNYQKLILKPVRFSCGGQGICLIDTDLEEEQLVNSLLSKKGQYICQSVVNQHPELNKLNSTSLNTLRIMTLYYNDNVRILSSSIRIGAKGANVDNLHSGGMTCGINDNGTLKSKAYDQNLFKHVITPEGFKFNEIVIPNFDICTLLAKKLALRFCGISKLISWDIAIDNNGNPVLIEMNLTFSGIDVPQFTNGPLFGLDTQTIMEEVMNNSYTFRKMLQI